MWIDCECTKNTAKQTELRHPTDPRVLTVGLLAPLEKGLVGPDDVAELQHWSSWRLLAHPSPPLRFAKALQHRCAPLLAPQLVSPVGGSKTETGREKTRISTHITCFAGQCSAFMHSWTVLQPRSMPDACKRLRTQATEQHGTVATQALISILARARS